jgi:TonB family protein
MKQILPFLLVLLTLPAFAQADDEPEHKAVVIHYNNRWEVTTPDWAAVKRLAYLPARLNDIQNLFAPHFQYAVTDYYANNTVLARGYYNEAGKKWGKWIFYQPNGKPDCEGSFEDNRPAGVWKFWKQNGEPLMEVAYEAEGRRLLNSWDPQGVQTLTDGNGLYHAEVLAPDRVSTHVLQGQCVGGLQVGTWQITNSRGQVELEQYYNDKGKFVGGALFKDGKLAKKYKEGDQKILGYTYDTSDRIVLQGVPDYTDLMENWKRDRRVYLSTYPVVAEMLGGKVEKIMLQPTKNGEEKYYYRITQQFENAPTDTIIFGAPVTQPVFRRGDHDYKAYFAKHANYPSELKSGKLEGLVVVAATITAEGKVADARIEKGLSPKVDAEVLRLVQGMPDWKPGDMLGKPISVNVVLPFRFSNGSYKGD